MLFVNFFNQVDLIESTKGQVTLPNRINFRENSKGGVGGGSFSIEKFVLQILGLYKRLLFRRFPKQIAIEFSEYEVGGPGPFGIFPKIHPIW